MTVQGDDVEILNPVGWPGAAPTPQVEVAVEQRIVLGQSRSFSVDRRIQILSGSRPQHDRETCRHSIVALDGQWTIIQTNLLSVPP